MCGCEFNIAAAGSAVAGTVLGHFSSSSDTSAIYHSAMRHIYLEETLHLTEYNQFGSSIGTFLNTIRLQ